MLCFDDGLPIQRGQVTEDVERRIRRAAVEDDIEPVISPKAFRGVVFIGRQRDSAMSARPFTSMKRTSMAVFGSSGFSLREMRSKPQLAERQYQLH